MSDDTTKLLNACVEYRAMVDKLEAENTTLKQYIANKICPTCDWKALLEAQEQENAALRELTSTLGAPNHINIPVEKWHELRKDKERLDSGTILLTVDGERVHHIKVDLRAAIDAARKAVQRE